MVSINSKKASKMRGLSILNITKKKKIVSYLNFYMIKQYRNTK